MGEQFEKRYSKCPMPTLYKDPATSQWPGSEQGFVVARDAQDSRRGL
jgi:hypothetical protein